ncbi:hypothetical protein JZ751_004726 [Albula glossodonta]|uniref:Ig-like domain-containing protein n=1 Tax=Albula glossodonta TaxID=121402 RepID=A0A8T2N4R6_9TELE|nr:hypothetical protein JZ751_004726 [Albula glossodonta]
MTDRDSATYRFRFLTNTEGGKYTGQPGVTLTVTDLQVSVDPSTVTEGQRVTLTCRTTCTLTGSSAFIWYKNSKVISNETRMQYSFILTSRDDTALYSCAIKGSLRAETDSDTVTEGQWVTLTCRTTCAHLRYRQTFYWYENGQLQNETSRYLQFTASSERAGRYSCGVWYGSKKKRGTPGERARAADAQSARLDPHNDTYTVLNPKTVSPDYETLSSARPDPQDDTYTGLNLKTVSPDYDTLNSMRNTATPAFIWYKNRKVISNETRMQYIFILTSSEDTDLYSCAIKGSVRAETHSDTVTEGQRVTLTCRTTCAHLSYSNSFRWYKNGQDLSETSEYLAFRASSERAGSYSCDAPKGTSVLMKPSGVIKEGSSVTLTCSSDANPAVQSYTWYKDNRRIASWTASGQSYTIDSIGYSNAAEYYCETSNVIGEGKSPHVEIAPDTVTEGQSVTLTCRTICAHLRNINYFSWYKNGQYLSNTMQGLQFTASSGDTDSYSCAVYNNKNLISSAVALNLRWVGAVVVICAAGGATAFVVLVLIAATVLECKRKKRGTPGERARAADAQSARLDPHNDTYTVLNPKTVSPDYDTLSLRAETHSDTVTEGQWVTLTCRTTCTHLSFSYSFRWYKNGQLQNETSGYLQFRASSERAGRYSCGVRYGSKYLTSHAVTLKVKYAPKGTSVLMKPSGVIKEGSSVTLTCISDANPAVQSYTWYKDNRRIASWTASGQSYSIKSITLSDSGEYYCETWNGIGTGKSPPKRKTGIVSAIVGLAAIVALVFLAVIVWKRRRNSVKEAESREEDKEDNKSPVYDDISEIALSHTAAQDTNRDDDEIALYSTVQPANTSSQEESLYSNVKTLHPKSGHDAQYSSITFSKHSAAPRSSPLKVEDDSVLYSTVAKHNT